MICRENNEIRLRLRKMRRTRPSSRVLFQNVCLHRTGCMTNRIGLIMYACMLFNGITSFRGDWRKGFRENKS